jgi:hypothetical protein
MDNQKTTTTSKPERIDPEQQKFDARINELVAQATPADIGQAQEIASGEPDDAVRVTLTPTLAAVIFRKHNGRNRDFTLSKAKRWARAMERGEWKLTHQGIAFAAGTNKLFDGQHRCAAVVMSGCSIEFWVFRRHDPDVIDAIDQSDKRSAWETLKLGGIADSKEKEQITRRVIAYTRHAEGNDEAPSVIEIEQYVLDHNDALNEALTLARESEQENSLAESTMKAKDAAAVIHLMQVGEAPAGMIRDFVFSLQRGAESREGGVIVPMAKMLIKASRAEQRRDRMSRDQIFSTLLKAYMHWARGERVASFKPVKSGQYTPYKLADVVQPETNGSETSGSEAQPSA